MPQGAGPACALPVAVPVGAPAGGARSGRPDGGGAVQGVRGMYAGSEMENAAAKLGADPAPILSLAGLDEAARAVAGGAATCAQAAARLCDAGALDAALRFYAFALPRREAVWWACMCVAATAPAPGAPPGPDIECARQARAAGERWVRRQDEDSRRAAQAAAQAAGFRVPEAWVAMAAFWSGGSLAPVGQPVVPPAPHLTGTAVHGAVSLAAVRTAPQLRAARMSRFLASARDIGAGGAGQIARETA